MKLLMLRISTSNLIYFFVTSLSIRSINDNVILLIIFSIPFDFLTITDLDLDCHTERNIIYHNKNITTQVLSYRILTISI